MTAFCAGLDMPPSLLDWLVDVRARTELSSKCFFSLVEMPRNSARACVVARCSTKIIVRVSGFFVYSSSRMLISLTRISFPPPVSSRARASMYCFRSEYKQ